MRRLVVGFDLDQTLVDSAAGIAATLRAAVGEAGVDVPRERIWEFNGVPIQDTLAALAPGVDVDAVTRRYRELYPTYGVPPTRLLPGAREALAAVNGAGGRTMIVSTKVSAAVLAVLDHVGLGADRVVGGHFGSGKGQVLAVAGAHAYVGDHPGDVLAAQVAGATAVAVATGPHGTDQLAAAGADVVLPDLTAFPAWFDRFVVDGLTTGSSGRAPRARRNRSPDRSGTAAPAGTAPRAEPC